MRPLRAKARLSAATKLNLITCNDDLYYTAHIRNHLLDCGNGDGDKAVDSGGVTCIRWIVVVACKYSYLLPKDDIYLLWHSHGNGDGTKIHVAKG